MSDNIQDTTRQWVEAVLTHYENFDGSVLNQVHIKGYFAGMSVREVRNLAMRLKENALSYPLPPRSPLKGQMEMF